MSHETSMHAHAETTEQEDREQAVAAATTLVRARYDDPDAWVRLAFSAREEVSTGRVYHFDAFGPLVPSGQHRVIAAYSPTDVWEARLAD